VTPAIWKTQTHLQHFIDTDAGAASLSIKEGVCSSAISPAENTCPATAAETMETLGSMGCVLSLL